MATLSLGNRVFVDLNGDGVFQDGEGRGGVHLSLFLDEDDDDIPDGPAIATAVTDPISGSYSFTGLAAGNYIVQVDAPNFTRSGALNGRVSLDGAADPDDNVDGDDNGILADDGSVRSKGITLVEGAEPSGNVNSTLDFGFVTPNQAPTASIAPLSPRAPVARANTFTAGAQGDPAVATFADGSYLITWTSAEQDGSGSGIYARRYDASGTALGDEFQVTASASGDQLDPSVAALADGGYLLTWTSLDQDGDGAGICARRFDASGLPVSTEFQVNIATAGSQAESAVAALGDGFVIVWSAPEGADSGAGVYFRRYDADGLAIGGEARVNTFVTGNQWHPSLAALAGGGYVVAWVSEGQSGASQVYFQRFDAAGTPVGAETRTSFDTAQQLSPIVAALADGGFAIAHIQVQPFSDGTGTFIASRAWLYRYDSAGQPVGAVRLGSSNHVQGADVVSLTDGGFLAAWRTTTGTFAQRFDATGAARGGEIALGGLSVAALGALLDGGFIVAGTAADGSETGVYLQPYAAEYLATEQTSLDLKGSMRVADADAAATTVTVTLSVSAGILEVAAGTSGASVANSGSSSVTITGMIAQINDLLVTNATSSVSYTANSDAPAPAATITLHINDNGSGGGNPLFASDNETIHITTVNDAPVNAVPAAQAGTEDANLIFSAANGNAITVFDPDGDILTVTLAVDHGMLSLAGSLSASPQLQLGGTAAQINAALNGLIYRGDVDYNGTDTLTIFTTDGPHSFTIGDGAISFVYGEGVLADGDSLAITLADDNELVGTDGNDVLSSPGPREMRGGPGDDIYIVDHAGDIVTELPDEGTDEVRTSLGDRAASPVVRYVLPANVEILTGTLGRGQAFEDNAENNVITTSSGADLIVARNGGNDSVSTGSGNDFLFFGNTFTTFDTVDAGAGRDKLGLHGTYNLAFLATSLTGVEKLLMWTSGDPANDFDYSITTHDGNVAAGTQLEVTALSLAANETLVFNGSAETNGSFWVRSGAGNDTITGGAGADRIMGGLGADRLTGGGGADRFDMLVAAHSTSTGYDTLVGFDASQDRINVQPAFGGWAGTASGELSTATFDIQLADMVDNLMGARQAVKVTASGGDLDGKIFVVFDANGDGSYIAGQDLVWSFEAPAQPNLEGFNFFV